MNGTKLIYPNMDYGHRQGGRSIAAYFEYAQEVLSFLPKPDRNYFETFGKYGTDFSSVPTIRPSIDILKRDFAYLANKEYERECHNTAEHELRSFKDPQMECKLWWGVVDAKTKEEYMGMFHHSFLTISVEGRMNVWDPMLMREDLLETGSDIWGHYGIQLPLEYLDRIRTHAGMEGRNFSAYLIDKVFRSQKLTKRLCSVLEKTKTYPSG